MARNQSSGEKVWCQVKMVGKKGPQHLTEAVCTLALSLQSHYPAQTKPPKAFWIWNSQMGGFLPSLPGALSRLPRLMGAEVGLGLQVSLIDKQVTSCSQICPSS